MTNKKFKIGTGDNYHLAADALSVAIALSDADLQYASGAAPAKFQIDWSTGTGSGDSVLRDTGKTQPFHGTELGGNRLDVITTASLGGANGHGGFPTTMTNCLRHKFPAVPSEDSANRADFLVIPKSDRSTSPIWDIPVGGSLYTRVYFRADYLDVGSEGGASHHPFENQQGYPTVDNVFWNWHMGNATDGTFPINLFLDSNSSPDNVWSPNTAFGSPTNLTKGHVYRLETAVFRSTSTLFGVKVRIYDATVSDSTLLYPDTNGTETKMVNGNSTKTLLTKGNNFTIPNNDTDTVRGIRMGNNGWTLTFAAACYDYFGGLVVRDSKVDATNDVWCGPYNATLG